MTSEAPDVPNLVHVHAFARIAQTGSITEAGRQLNISQPAITQGISKLEQALNVRLFDRRHNGMSLTAAGEVYLQRARRGIDILQRAVGYLSRSSSKTLPRAHRLFSAGQLRALVATVDVESFRMAALAVGVETSTIQRACRHLERQVGCALFEMTSSGMRATRQGKELGRLAKLAIAEFRQAFFDVGGWKGSFEGQIAVGCLPLAQTTLLPMAINSLSAEYPLLSISIVDGRYEDLFKGLRDGELDFILGALRAEPPVADVVQAELFVDRMKIVCRKGHPLDGEADVTLEKLGRFAWVAPRRGSPGRAFFENFHSRLAGGAQPQPIETGALPVVRGILLGSDRLTIISTQQVRYELEQGLLVALDHPIEGSSRTIGIATRRDWSPTIPQRRLLELLQVIAKNE